jgi:hypothetical protein
VTFRILLSTDLDRTLLPNGDAEESPRARERFATVAQRDAVVLVYVTGRHHELVRQAIERYDLPLPRIVIGDVGSSIHEVSADGWSPWEDWQNELGAEWTEEIRTELRARFEEDPDLKMQDESSQTRFKVSAFAPASRGRWMDRLRAQLDLSRTQLVHSVDERENTGLLDALPARAGKLGALEFVRRRLGIAREHTLFAGDSGNDLEVLISSIPAVLVANATPEMKRQAQSGAMSRGHADALYVAGGGLLGMNGNYAAGILEGLVHHFPRTRSWIS